MAYLIVTFGLWLLWNIFLLQVATPAWFPSLLFIALGIGAACLIDVDHWWYGVGLAGGAGFLLAISDLLLVTTDSIRAGIVQRRQRRG
jgi:hypothetical protein